MPLCVGNSNSETESMFVYYFLHVHRPLEEATRIVLDLLDGFADAADIAYRSGEELRMRAGVGNKVVAKTVNLQVGSAIRQNDEVVVPLRWEATGVPGLFPAMEADLVLASVGPRITQITFRGSYKPPLGGLGEAIDRALLHRVAEATVKHFVDRVGAAVVGWPHHERAGAL